MQMPLQNKGYIINSLMLLADETVTILMLEMCG